MKKPPQFSPAILGNENEYYKNAATAFENLTIFFVQDHYGSTPNLFFKILKCIRFDHVAVTCMLKRFQRDAFGVSRFDQIANEMVKAKKFTESTKKEILDEVHCLGLRITADSPRKTRVPAAFSLWMCVYRPVSFDSQRLPEISAKNLEEFCAMVNYFLTSNYLSKFGNINLGQTQSDRDIRLERIRHDFTCREVSFSSLETFYSAIFELEERFMDPDGSD